MQTLGNKLDRFTAAEEVLAELAQTRPEIGIVQRAIAAIRTWLRQNVPGFKNMRLSDNELIRNYILPARAFVERGNTEVSSDGIVSFMRGAPLNSPGNQVSVTEISTRDITGVDHPISNKELRKIADEILRDIRKEIALGERPLVNDETGWSFSVASKDLGKMGNNPHMKPESSKSAIKARDIVKVAALVETHADTHGHGADAVHRFYAPVAIDGKLYRVRLTVMDYNETLGKRNLHAIRAIEIENTPPGTLQPADVSGETATATQPTTGRAVSLSHLLNGVKGEDGRLLLSGSEAPDSGGAMFSRSIGDTLTSAANSARDVNLPAGYKVGDHHDKYWRATLGATGRVSGESAGFAASAVNG